MSNSSSRNDKHPLWETPISSSHVYDGKLLQVYVDEVMLPNDTTSTRDWIKHPGASAVVPVFNDGTIMLIRQFRYPPRKVFIEVPAGKLDPGEPADVTAKRELKEETGISCDNLQHVGSCFPAIGYADEEIFNFVAWGLTESEISVDDDEFVITQKMPFKDALGMIYSGEIKDSKTISALVQAANWWKENGPFTIDLP